MASTGFFEQKTGGPGKFGMVLALHAAAIGGVLLIKGPIFNRIVTPPIRVIDVNNPPPPDPVTPQPEPQRPRDTLPDTRMDRPEILVPTPLPPTLPPGPTSTGPTTPGGNGQGIETADATIPDLSSPPPRVPVLRGATMLSGSGLQPPYPASEIRNEREGTVRVRVTIDENGRVIAVTQVSATSEAFFQATQRQALRSWRFRPATEDGRPVQSSQVLTVQFRLDGAG